MLSLMLGRGRFRGAARSPQWHFGRCFIVAIAGGLAIGAHGARSPAYAGSNADASVDGAVLGVDAPGLKQADIATETQHLAQQVSALRKLSLRRKIATEVLSREQIIAKLSARVAKEYTQDEIATEAAVLQRLGLWPAELDYRETVLALLAEQVAGFYDPESRRLAVASWLALPLQKPTLAHEICHALQDQHFGLERFTSPIKDNGDRQLARSALVEGDCTGVMLEYLLAPNGLDLGSIGSMLDPLLDSALQQGGERFRQAPEFLRETLTFPYLRGVRFIQHWRTRESWGAMRRLFVRPPATTEQVLHPDKYINGERPIVIRTGSLAALRGWTELRQDTLGEFQWQLLLRVATSREIAERAAAGWNGDRLVAYRSPKAKGLPAIVLLSAWDSEEDAVELVKAQRQWLLARLGQPAAAPNAKPTDAMIFTDASGAQWSSQRVGSWVLMLIAFPPETRAQLQQQIWRSWRANRRALPRPPTH